MPVNLIPENELRAALRPHRVDPELFEAGVRARLQAAQAQRAEDPLLGLSPLRRSAAAFLPLTVLAGCQAPAPLARAGGAAKLLGYLAFPAISLFVLLGAAVFSVAKIRGLRAKGAPGLENPEALQAALREWWRHNRWAAVAVFAATLALSLIGAAWLLFVMYIVSFGILLYVLTGFAKLGLGNRQVIGASCAMGLVFLGQLAGFAGIGVQDIHFLDQTLVAAVCFGGALVLLPLGLAGSPLAGGRREKLPRWMWALVPVQLVVALVMWLVHPDLMTLLLLLGGALVLLGSLIFAARYAGERIGTGQQWTLAALVALLVVPLMGWMMHPLLWPATPTRIKHYVESFDRAPFTTVSWQRWEIAASWALESKLNPDFSRPRRLLDQELAGSQNPYILGNALRVGLLPVDKLDQLKNYQAQRRFLVTEPPRGILPQVITSLDQQDWVIRAAVLRKDLSPAERDLLEQRLHATLTSLFDSPQVVLSEPLRVTQLLDVLDRPLNRDQYRASFHDLLRKFHTTHGGGFHLAGGFKTILSWPAGAWTSQPGALEPTAYAIELMEIYGVPDGLDMNWVRAFLRPSVYRLSDDKWVAAATLDRLNHLPGVPQPTWLEFLYYERTLLAAAVLVGLCLYATLISPKAAFQPPVN